MMSSQSQQGSLSTCGRQGAVSGSGALPRIQQMKPWPPGNVSCSEKAPKIDIQVRTHS